MGALLCPWGRCPGAQGGGRCRQSGFVSKAMQERGPPDKEPSVRGCPARASLSPSWELGFSCSRPAPCGHRWGLASWTRLPCSPGPWAPRVRSHWYLPSAWGALAHAWGHQLVQAFVPVGGMPMVPLHWPLEHRPEPAAVSGCPSEDCLSDPTPRPASGFPAPAPWPEPSCQGCGSLLPAVGVQAPDPGPPPQVLRPLLISLPPPSCLPDGNKSTEGCPDSCGSSGAVMATAFGARALETQVGAQCLRAVAAPLTRRPRTLQPESPCVRVSVGLGVLNLKHEVAQPERPGWWAVGAPVVTLRQELAQVAGCRLGPWGRAPPAVVINEPGHNPATSGG